MFKETNLGQTCLRLSEKGRKGKKHEETGKTQRNGRKSKETRRNRKRNRMKITNLIDVNKITQRLWRGRTRRQENKQ